MKFKNRVEAGKRLAALLQMHHGQADNVVIGLARGGILTAAEIAKELKLPLDIIVARKIGVPDQPDLVVGGLTSTGTLLYKEDLMQMLGLTQAALAEVVEVELSHARQLQGIYRAHCSDFDVRHKTVLLIDDGIVSCSPIRAAIAALRLAGARKIIVAVPVAPADSLDAISQEADEVVCLEMPEIFPGINFFYESYPTIEDAEIIALLTSHQ